VLVAEQAPLAPAEDPVIPQPVIPQPVIPQPPAAPAAAPDPAPVVQQPDPVPVQQPAIAPEVPILTPQSPDVPAAGATPLYPPELATPGLPAVGPSAPELTAPALTAPALTAPVLTGPEFQLSPLATPSQPGPPMEDPAPAPWIQPLDPTQQSLTTSGCPYDAAPGALLPPSVWSVCPGLQPGLAYSPFLAYSPLRQPWVLTPSPSQISIPWVAGYRADSAEQTLALSGLNVGSVTEQGSASPRGTVLRTDPPFGSAVEFGRAVDLVVAGR
jgi:hypothetical protein